MKVFDVKLELVRGAKPTGERMDMTVLGTDRLSAALTAEANADRLLPDPGAMYSHAVAVHPASATQVAATMAAAA